MSKAEYNKFGQKLAVYTAPTLLGIKCGSLVSLSSSEFDLEAHLRQFNRRAVGKGLKSRIICSFGERALFFVYNEKLLEKRLSDKSVRTVLTKYGYHEKMRLDECLDLLSGRMNGSGGFPHEIGIFLGYPLEDVIGFIENKGNNYKLCGAWKVYGNAENARRIFANYDKCRIYLCNKLNSGEDIYHALKIS